MADIIEPEAPTLRDDIPQMTLAGDWHDDDGQAFDDILDPAPQGPLSYDDPVRGAVYADTLDQPTRLIYRAFSMTGGDDPVQALPVDLNRLSLQVKFTASSAQGQMHIGSDKTDVYQGPGLPVVQTGGVLEWRSDWLMLDAHTGALWIWPDPAAGGAGLTFRVVVTAVTR